MKKQKRRYTHEGQIEVDIEKAKQRAKKLHAEAEMLMDSAREHFKKETAWDVEQGIFLREKAGKLKTTAGNLTSKKIPYLAQKLAEFKTMTLPGMVPDEAIPV